ncbi:MAG: hypothetical protein ACK4YF_07225 [Exilispira sp.]
MRKINLIYRKKKLFIIILVIIILSIFNITVYSQENQITEEINKNLATQNQNENSQKNNSSSAFFIRTLLVLIFLLILYFFIKYRFNKTTENKSTKKYFSILFKQSISRNISLAVLEFFGSYYIISIGNDINILEKIDNQEIIDFIKLEASKEQPKKTFLDYLGFPQDKIDSKTVISKFNELKDKMSKIKKGNT